METHHQHQNSTITKIKLLCSYGGKIQTRQTTPETYQLSYIGGDTKILAVDRKIKFSEIISKLNSLSKNLEISVKYQLPGEDLDNLVSLIDDEDVEHMMAEYDRMQLISSKPVRLRLFVFDISSPPPVQVNLNPDYLFGFDKEYKPSIGSDMDLLQIPGMILPQNCELVEVNKSGIGTESGKVNNVSQSGVQNVYRLPVVGNGGVFQTAQFANGMVAGMTGGNWQQPVYNFVPIVPSVQGNK